jgi:hypothetical protein
MVMDPLNSSKSTVTDIISVQHQCLAVMLFMPFTFAVLFLLPLLQKFHILFATEQLVIKSKDASQKNKLHCHYQSHQTNG